MSARRRRAWAGLLAAAALTGCDARASFFVRDTDGWGYRARCTPAGCSAELEAPYAPAVENPCARGARPGFALAGAGVIAACHACVGAGAPRVDPSRCRPLACQDDHECPPFAGAVRLHCAHGLCETPDAPRALDAIAATALCMSGAGPSGEAHPSQLADRLALARAACSAGAGGVCAAPAGCRAP